MPADPPDLGPLIDHHCHGLVLDDLDRRAFESLINEADNPSALGTTFFDSMLGLAIRKWCAPVLGLEAHASAEDYLARRRELGVQASQRLVTASGIETFLVDTGLNVDQLCSPADIAAMSGGTAYEVVRLEALAEELLNKGTGADDFAEAVEEALHESTAVATKSIAAYRIGLELPADPPSIDSLTAALASLRPADGDHYRIAHPVINSWLAWTAIKIGKPLQIHVGYGDADLDLRLADPLHLTPFLRATEEQGVPVLLLHNYPFHRNAAYLAQVFNHVFIDLGLAVHNAGGLSQVLIRETLELVPFGKLLFSTDAYGLAEFYYLGAKLFRRGLSTVLSELIDADEMNTQDAGHLVALITRDNARRIYRLW
ncbi:MAG TPA: amidohydrolase family protein [Propionibacteriaceae bacterium]